jgi:hypothetical protein
MRSHLEGMSTATASISDDDLRPPFEAHGIEYAAAARGTIPWDHIHMEPAQAPRTMIPHGRAPRRHRRAAMGAGEGFVSVNGVLPHLSLIRSAEDGADEALGRHVRFDLHPPARRKRDELGPQDSVRVECLGEGLHVPARADGGQARRERAHAADAETAVSRALARHPSHTYQSAITTA